MRHRFTIHQLISRLVITLGFLLAGFGQGTVLAEDFPDDVPSEPWHISADQIDYDQVKDEYLARGNVSIIRPGRSLTADMVRLNQGSKQAVAEGNVRLVYGDNILSGRQLELDLESETGTLVDGTVFISPNHLYLSGKRIRKTGAQTFTMEDAHITSCDGPDPDWELTGSDLAITVEGYGTAKHTTLWAGKVPVFYSPYLVFPVKLKRQSGLLMPELGYSSRKGAEYTQPLFWAIDESRDATVYAHYMSERGVRTGLEYRYVIDANARGAIFAEGYTDQRIDDGIGDNTVRWGYGDDPNLRTNEGRYWLRMKHDQEVGLGLNAKLDVDVVSDQDYLREFKSSYNGFDRTQAYFQGTFGRGIDDYNDAVRLNRLNLNRTWSQYSLNADLRWFDDVIKRTGDSGDDTLQQLPAITFGGVKQVLGETPFYFDLATRYDHFFRIDGDRGQRIDLYPRIYYPIRYLGAVSVEPSLGFRQTAWHVDRYETEPDHGRDIHYRAIYDFRLDASAELFRVFNFTMAGSDLLKHTVTPEVTYEFIPEEDQSDFPQFDTLDTIARNNTVTYGITNTLTARSSRRTPAAGTTTAYTPFLRFKLSQSFDINKQNEADPRPFSNILAELDITPGRYVALDADAQWSVYDNRLETLNNALTIWDSRGDRLSVDYRITRESSATANDGIESISVKGIVSLDDQWAFRAGHDHNLYDDQAIETSIGVSYRSQCWGLDFDYAVEYNDEKDNHKVSAQFNLVGLGSFGT
jgi:LPS-assembly protein